VHGIDTLWGVWLTLQVIGSIGTVILWVERRRLRNELLWARAEIGYCIKCSVERHPGDLVRFEIWGPHGPSDPCPGEYSCVAWFGGGVGGAGKTPEDAARNSAENAKGHIYDAMGAGLAVAKARR
jgi:hypothetical protein